MIRSYSLIAVCSLLITVDAFGAEPKPPADAATKPIYIQPLAALLVGVSKSEKYVSISLGSEDGLQEGDKLDVSNGNKYKGRIEIVMALKERAVGRVVSSHSTMKPGDCVWNHRWKVLPCTLDEIKNVLEDRAPGG